jgi:hypothetical protein
MYFTIAGIQGVSVPHIDSITAVNTTATITLSSTLHGLVTNDVVSVINVGDAFDTASNGVAVTVSSAVLTYTIANVGSTVITATPTKYSRVLVIDSGTESATATVVTSAAIDALYANGTGQGSYNVPGGLNYNPDNNIDYIIKAND